MNKNFIIRKYCVICDNNNFNIYFEKDLEIPSNHSISNNKNDIIIPYNLLICKKCNIPQLKYLGRLDIIYNNNHNSNVISNTWIKHYDNFSNFIINNIIKKIKINNILEIGGGNNFIASNIINYIDDYTILEPNITEKNDKIKYIENWLENYESNISYDLVILSHVFEHLYKLEEIFKIKTNLIAISIPYLEKYIENNFINVLNIEHTYYYEKKHIIYYFSKFKYKLSYYHDYEDHSQFFIFNYDKNIEVIQLNKYNIISKIDKYFLNINNLVIKINNCLNKYDNCCLFPCNHYIHFLILFGLKIERINYLYDNNIDKNNKYLYGTKLMCKNLSFFVENNSYIIILAGSVYNKDLLENLKEKNIKYYNI